MEEIKMKDSGIKWIGQIPEGWNIKRLKYCVNCLDGKRIPIDAGLREEGPYPYWGAGSIQDYVNNYLFDEEIILLGEDGAPFFDKYRPVSFLVREKVWVNNHIHVLKGKKDFFNKFIVYFLNCVDYQEYINGSVLNKLTQENMNNIPLIFPSFDEQQKIADFLDKKCSNIDEIISKTEKQIETLEQYKKSLITETVTKGLNPNVKMKDSGYDWIGQIPEKWSVKKMKYCCDVIGSGTTPDSSNIEFYENGTIPWIQSGDLYQKDTITETEKKITTLAVQSSLSLKLYKKDFLVIAMYGASVGNAAISKIDAYVNQACCAINSIRNNIKFIYYWIKSANNYLIDVAFGGTQPNISQIIIKNTPIVIPSREEQDKIVEFLDQKYDKVNKVLNKQKESLETLKKYKQSLIYEYVTGKKRV